MSEQIIVEEFAALFVADLVIAPLFTRKVKGQDKVNAVAVPSAEVCAEPLLTFELREMTPYSGGMRISSVGVIIRSPMDAEGIAPNNHTGRVTAVRTKLLGAPGATLAATRTNEANAHAAVIAAINARGKVELRKYGLGAEGILSEVEDESLKTAIALSVSYRLRSPAV